MDSFYTVEQLATMFHLSKTTIQRKLEKGEMVGHKLGKEWRVSHDQLRDYLKQTINQKEAEALEQ